MVQRARPIVRAATGITLTKRIILTGLTIPDITSADFDNPLEVVLLECTEAQDEEVESNGSTIADTPLYSRLLKMRLQVIVQGSTSVSNIYRWMLIKEPDGDVLTSTLVDANFHSSNDTQANRELRKYTLAKGMFVTNPSSAVTQRNIYVSRKAWKRASPMREGDTLSLFIAKDAGGTTSLLSGFGSIWVKANG